MSMMGHRVRVLPYSTFRMNVTVTSPYNADFDGDEMNMHVPQSHETQAEMRHLMMVPHNIVSGQANKPVVGIVQDSLVGARIMTMRDQFLTRSQIMAMMLALEDWDGRVPTPAILKPEPLWTGKQVISLFLPDVNLRGLASWGERDEPDHTPADTRVIIERGELLTGTLCKSTLGASGGGLVHTIWMQLGGDETRRFLNHINFTVTLWLQDFGFSVGVGDCVVGDKTMEEIDKAIEKSKRSVDEVLHMYKTKKLESKPGMTVEETFENNVSGFLNEARDVAGKIVRLAVPESNSIKRMASSGSKGKDLNLAQIIACVAQQNVEGKRIMYGFAQRTLPHFVKGDLGPEARGFVQNSYIKGLTPTEFFFHACGGREGLIDTAVKTATSGYTQRKFIKGMEDLMVAYDGTVRNAVGEIVQFLYGEDGMDPTQLEKQSMQQAGMKRPAFMAEIEWPLDNPAWCDTQDALAPQDLLDLRSSPEGRRLIEEELTTLEEDWRSLRVGRLALLPPNESQVVLPCNLSRLIWTAQTRFGVNEARRSPSGLRVEEVIQRVRELVESLVVVKGNDGLSKEAQENATRLLAAHMRFQLASKKIIGRYRLTRDAFNWLMGEIERRFNMALSVPGEMVGVIAAQSLGEPTTQMTLNT